MKDIAKRGGRVRSPDIRKRTDSHQRIAHPEIEEIEKITWEAEVHENYNGQEDLGLILEFSGIRLTDAPFEKSRVNYEPDSSVFHSKVGYKGEEAYLILSTFGDIFESQVVADKKDVNPFFIEEIFFFCIVPHFFSLYHPFYSLWNIWTSPINIF